MDLTCRVVEAGDKPQASSTLNSHPCPGGNGCRRYTVIGIAGCECHVLKRYHIAGISAGGSWNKSHFIQPTTI